MGNSAIPREERDYLQYLRDVHFKNQNGLCYFCSCEMTSPEAGYKKTMVTIEHLRGRESGGGSNFLNTAASCLECNQMRSKQKQIGNKTLPRVVIKKLKEFTYSYTTPDNPKVLVLFNSTSNKSRVIEEAQQIEGSPVTIKHVLEI